MTCHYDFFNLVYSLRSQGYLVLVLYLDISKAFDMVSHQLLIGKFASYGVQNPLLAWFDSFPSNRHQIVKMNSSLSNAVPVRSGVIQGSVFSSRCIKDKLRLESVQRRFTLRTLGTDSVLTYNSRCSKLGLDPLWKRRLKINLIFFFKILSKLSFTSSQAIQYAKASHYDIRNSLSLAKQTYSRSSLYINYFACKFSRLWYNLPQTIRMLNSLPLFVRSINAYCSSENSLNALAPASVSYSTSEIIGTLN
ncbi:unnamed protein product, partial [Schistosoma rodhaini]